MIEITVPSGEVTLSVPAGETVILHGRPAEDDYPSWEQCPSAYQWVPNEHGFPTLQRSSKEAASSHHESHNVTSADSLLVGTFAMDQQGTITRHQPNDTTNPDDLQANGISVNGHPIGGSCLRWENSAWTDAPSRKLSKEDILEALGR